MPNTTPQKLPYNNNDQKSTGHQTPVRHQQQTNGVSPTRQYTTTIVGQDANSYHHLEKLPNGGGLVSHGQPNANNFQQFATAAATTNKLAALSGKQAGCEIHHSVLHNMTGRANHRHQAGQHSNQNSKKKVNFCRAWLDKFPSRSKRIDVISRIFFPKMFALFNLVYWTTYLFREDDIVQS